MACHTLTTAYHFVVNLPQIATQRDIGETITKKDSTVKEKNAATTSLKLASYPGHSQLLMFAIPNPQTIYYYSEHINLDTLWTTFKHQATS